MRMPVLEINQPFPDFALPDQHGETRRLADFAGRWLVIYCYPKDNTSACSLEAQDFTRVEGAFTEAGAAIVGVSPDSPKSHASFIAKKELGIPLLSDTKHTLLEAAGVWQKKKLYGREYMGVVRSTFLVDPGGVVREVWTNVKVPGHAEAVLTRFRELQSSAI
jgi:peroxiredoxin Q/BCP